MTGGRLALIFLILVVASIAWAVLGGTVMQRTNQADSNLRSQVEGLWGQPLTQVGPAFAVHRRVYAKPRDRDKWSEQSESVLADKNSIKVDLKRDFRRKGLLWYRCYRVVFDADYLVNVDTQDPVGFSVSMALPAVEAVYENFSLTLNGKPFLPGASSGGASYPQASSSRGMPPPASGGQAVVQGRVELKPGDKARLHVHYETRGLESYQYKFADGVANIKHFTMVATTDFGRVNYPPRTVSPGKNEAGEGEGRKLTWQFDSLISGFAAGVEMPEKLSAGPVASRIAFFAPVGLLFFMAVVVIIGLMKDKNLHPVHYFFIAAAFFSFHLLFSYLADHFSVMPTFLISSAVSVLLVVSYVIRVLGARFTLGIVAPSQLLFLVLFSYAFFFNGYTGLTITIASVLVLGVLMHVTAGVKWDERFGASPPKRPSPPPPPVG